MSIHEFHEKARIINFVKRKKLYYVLEKTNL